MYWEGRRPTLMKMTSIHSDGRRPTLPGKPRRGAFCKTGCVSCQKSVSSLFYAASLGMATPHKRASMGSPRPSAHPALLTKKTIGILTAPRTVRGRQYPYRCKRL